MLLRCSLLLLIRVLALRCARFLVHSLFFICTKSFTSLHSPFDTSQEPALCMRPHLFLRRPAFVESSLFILPKIIDGWREHRQVFCSFFYYSFLTMYCETSRGRVRRFHLVCGFVYDDLWVCQMAETVWVLLLFSGDSSEALQSMFICSSHTQVCQRQKPNPSVSPAGSTERTPQNMCKIS